jgi:hypothetical protein
MRTLPAVPDTSPTVPPHTLPLPVRVAAALVALEGLAVIGYAGVQLAAAVDGVAQVAISVGVFFLVYGAGQLLVARGLWRCEGWARSGAVATQLIQLGVAWSLRDDPTTALAVVLAVVAAATAALLLTKASMAVFADADDPDGADDPAG